MTSGSPGEDQEQLFLDMGVPDEGVSQENEDDLPIDDLSKIGEAVVTSTDWTTETLLGQLGRGNIELNPRFQRREAWGPSRKSKFIESLILGLPIPQLVLAERRDKRGSYIVIDGKQRLLALRQFCAEPNDQDFPQLKLSTLEVRQDLNGLTFESLKADATRQSDVTAFENQTIRTVVVKNWPDEAFLYLVFLRLNTGSVPLNPQELRQALHPGPFVDFADDFSFQSPVLHRVLHNEGPDFRMRDVEILIRCIGFSLFLSEYTGNLKIFLDETCRRLNDEWPARESEIRTLAAGCIEAIEATLSIMGEDYSFGRWNGTRFEGRFNRAVFDIMTYYFRSPAIGSAARANSSAAVEAFKQLCDSNQEFMRALQTTTKSIPATFRRLKDWGDALAEAIKVPVPVPSLNEQGRIVPSAQ